MIFRSPSYLAAVRSIPCVNCGRYGCTQAAHSNQIRFGKGKGLKSSDATAMALCCPQPERSGCHAVHDQGGKLKKLEWWEFEYQMIVLTVLHLIRAKKLIGSEETILAIPASGSAGFERAALYLIGAVENRLLEVSKCR